MPTSRSHGGAELQKAPLNLPGGFRGLNTQESGGILGPEWATSLINTTLDGGGRVTARKGWLRRSSDGNGTGTAMMARMWEYETHSGAVEYVATDVDNNFWVSKDDGGTWADLGSVSDPYAEAVNYKDKLYIYQNGFAPLVYDGTTLGPYTEGATVTGHTGVALSAFGRMWVSTDGYNVVYNALLDETDWAFADPTSNAGAFDLRHLWEDTDTIVAMSEFNGSLVVFGSKNILIWSDGEGSDHAMNPSDMYVVDVLHGVGCVARDSVVELEGDIWWLSDSGMQSMARVIEQRSNPLNNISRHVHDNIMSVFNQTDPKQISAVYSPEERFVLITFPDGNQGDEGGLGFCFDSRGVMEDGSARCLGIWNILVPKCLLRMSAQKELLMFVGTASPPAVMRAFTENVAGTYAGFEDPRSNVSEDVIVPYFMVYESSWNNFDTPYLKMPKKLRAILYTEGEVDTTMSLWYDFDEFRYEIYNNPVNAGALPSYYTSPRDGAGTFLPVTEEGIEWNDNPTALDGGTVEDQVDPTDDVTPVKAGEYSGAFKPVVINVPSVRGTGEYVKTGLSARIAGFSLSIQETSLYIKQGRLI